MQFRWLGVVLILGACGDDGVRALPDAPTVDGETSVDAPPGGAVTVTAWTGNGVRDPDAIVLFQTASGSLVSRAGTDANGSASGDVPAGGMVTVVQGDTITTIVQVGGGDALTVGNNVMAMPGTATVVVPVAPAGTTNHQVLGACGGGSSAGTTISFAMVAACPQPSTVVAVARAGATTQAFLVESVAIGAGATTTLTGAWVAPAGFRAIVENVPASVTRVLSAAGSRFGTTTVYAVPTELPAPANGSSEGTIPFPPVFGDSVDVRLFVGQGFEAYQQSSETLPGTGRDTFTFDASQLLPWIESIDGDFADVAWTQSSGDDYDGAIATIEYQYKSSTQLTWRVILPPSARQFALPMLPSDIELPAQADQTEVHVELVDGTAFDWAGMRAMGGASSFRRDDTMPAIRTLRSSRR